jgi:hypothetical protein
VKRQLREDIKGRRSLRIAANSRVETIFNLRNALLTWFAQEREPIAVLLDDTRAMVSYFNNDDRFHEIATILNIMLVEHEPVMKALKLNAALEPPKVISQENAYEEMKESVMNLPDALAQVILNGIQGTCYFEYVSIAVMDILERDEHISITKIRQLESIANAGLKQTRKFNTILLRSMAEDEAKYEKSTYQDLSLEGLSNAYSVEETEYDYSMLISRNPKFEA